MTAERRPAGRLIAAAGLLAGITACAAPHPASETPVAAPAPTESAAPAPVTQQAARPPAPTPPASAPEPRFDVPAPDALIGKTGRDLHAALGDASLVRRDLGAEIWQYRTRDCVLFLFLYPSGGDNTVTHLEVRGDVETGACLESVVRAKLGLRTG